MKYKVKTTFRFTANVIVEASSKEEAEQISRTGFGCSNPDYHENDTRILTWNADSHSDRQVQSVTIA